MIALPQAVAGQLRRRGAITTNVVLFLATVATTIWAGALHQGVDLLADPGQFMAGVPYAAALLGSWRARTGSLLHRAAVRRRRDAPLFHSGSDGPRDLRCFNQMKALIENRRLCRHRHCRPARRPGCGAPGFVFGLRETPPFDEVSDTTGLYAGSSFLLAVIDQFANGGELGTAVISLSPVAFAGWIGLFITALNLMPVGSWMVATSHMGYSVSAGRATSEWPLFS